MKKVLILSCFLSLMVSASVIAQEAHQGGGYEAHKSQIQAQRQKLDEREQALDQRHQEREAFRAKAEAMHKEHAAERQQLKQARPQRSK